MSDPTPHTDLSTLAAQAASNLAGLMVELGEMAAPGREPEPGDVGRLASAMVRLASEVMAMRFVSVASARMVSSLSQAVADGVRAQAGLLELAEASARERDWADDTNPYGLHPSLLPDPDDD